MDRVFLVLLRKGYLGKIVAFRIKNEKEDTTYH